jgi:large subunit ribosomal protein L19
MDNVIKAIEKEHMRTDLPDISVGDTVKVYVKVVEGTRERLQTFEGYVIAKKNGGIREMITVRRVSFGVGIERSFPIHSPKIASIEKVRANKTRRSKLYFLRERAGKAAKLKEKR